MWPGPSKEFYERLEARGFTPETLEGQRYFLGLCPKIDALMRRKAGWPPKKQENIGCPPADPDQCGYS